VVADAHLAKELRAGSPWVALSAEEVFDDPGFVGRERGDYRLTPDSPLHGRGIHIPPVLNSAYRPGAGHEIVSRAWAKTRREDAPDPQAAPSVYGGEAGHYRLQPLPAFHRLVDLDSQPPGTPGLNLRWRETQQYPAFDAAGEPDAAADTDWMVFPENRLADPSFDRPMAQVGEAPAAGPWFSRGDLHTYTGLACANLFPPHQAGLLAFQKVAPLLAKEGLGEVGTVAPDCEYILWGDLLVSSVHDQFAAVGELFLAVGEALEPLGTKGSVQAEAKKTRSWNTCFARYRSGQAGEDPNVSQDLYVVLSARLQGPADLPSNAPVGFARWDNLVLLSGEKP
jgi:hypothetical protein